MNVNNNIHPTLLHIFKEKMNVTNTGLLSGQEQMCVDFTALNDEPGSDFLRFYTWKCPVVTIGYHQDSNQIREKLPQDARGLDIVRRPTGGGAVIHNNDLCYTGFITSGSLTNIKNPVTEIYKTVHTIFLLMLRALGYETGMIKRTVEHNPAGFCFTREGTTRFDLINMGNEKILGSAERRTWLGVMLQGSLSGKIFHRKDNAEEMWNNFYVPIVIPEWHYIINALTI